MDEKKVIEQLVKIAEKQQKILSKLAQSAPTPAGGATAGWELDKDQIQMFVDTLLSRRDPKLVGKVQVSGAHLDKENGQLNAGFTVDPAAAQTWEAISQSLSNALTVVPLKDVQGGEHKAHTVNFSV